MNIIGISAHFHDAACCLLKDGQMVAAAEEERFSRAKHDPRIPIEAFKYCLRHGELELKHIDALAYYENPIKKASRQLWMDATASAGRAGLIDAPDPTRVQYEIREFLGYEGPVLWFDHHQSHAAAAYYYSGFRDAAILTVDGVGEWATTTYGHGRDGQVSFFEEVRFPHSLGLLYSAITAYLGFDVNDAEYKVMGLAPYGKPRFVEQMHALLHDHKDGQYRLDFKYLDFTNRECMYTRELPELFGHPPREPESEVGRFHEDLARSLQVVLEQTLLEKARYLHAQVGGDTVCFSGGVALNCVANGRLRREGPFQHVFIPPAPSDAGSCLGAAALAHLQLSGTPIARERLQHTYLGPAFGNDEIRRLLDAVGVEAMDFEGNESDLMNHVVDQLAEGNVVGWFHGRMEFGPRALGARSIIADARSENMRDRINALVKKRESFRPFAPSVLEERAHEHFELDHASPFMLETCQVRSAISLPAITHVDGSARVQTVNKTSNQRFWRLLDAFARRTGCPILLNTSFNMRGEPIVCTPVDALICFARSGLDTLILEDQAIDRAALPGNLIEASESLSRHIQPAVVHRAYTL